ncbi:MAG: response regulator transcription factor [Elusimicrobia bacterium]|nr:response regulator transcription factor [Elusimicrobiota bacterium]
MLRRLLIAAPDAQAARALAEALPREEFLPRVETSSEDALECALAWRPDCVLLDSELARLPAVELCGRLKADPRTQRTPILMISPRRDQALVNRALSGGADDFMVHPCHPTELAWRVRGLLRRYEAPAPRSETLRLGPFELNTDQGLALVGGKPVELTRTELSMLELFVRNPSRVLNRRFLLENVWGYDRSVQTRVVDLCVYQLRKKLGARWGRCLATRRNFGYFLKLDA